VYENDSTPEGEDVLDSARITRRVAMQRAAVAGGALAFAVPVVQRLGQMTAGAVVSPVPPPPSSTPGFHGISYIAFVFRCNGTLFRLKWEEGGDGFDDFDGNNLPGCTEPNGWANATPYANHADVVVNETVIGGELFSVSFTVPVGCTITDGDGVAKGANPNIQGFCVTGVVSNSNRTITFTAPPKA